MNLFAVFSIIYMKWAIVNKYNSYFLNYSFLLLIFVQDLYFPVSIPGVFC